MTDDQLTDGLSRAAERVTYHHRSEGWIEIRPVGDSPTPLRIHPRPDGTVELGWANYHADVVRFEGLEQALNLAREVPAASEHSQPASELGG